MKKRYSRVVQFVVLVVLVMVLFTIVAGRATQADSEMETPEIMNNEIPAQTIIPAEQVVVKLETPVIPMVSPMPEEPEEDAEQVNQPERVARYADILLTDADYDLLAAVVFLEAGNQSAAGQQAVVEVIFNRLIHEAFPDTVSEVLWQEDQFSVMPALHLAQPGQAQYDAINAALYGPSILPDDVIFFARGPENDRVWGWIGDHCFCREYIWE